MTDVPPLTPAGRALAAAFAVSGTLHLVRPQLFTPLVPPALPNGRAWVLGSGVAELVCTAGLVTGRGWAAPATAGTLLGVWPGNWWYAVATQRRDAHPAHKAVAWARVPLQVPMIAAALRPWQPVTAAG
jgi:uncharacterized membrane protein